MPEWVDLVWDYAGVILALAAVIGIVNRADRDRTVRLIREELSPKLDIIAHRLDTAEMQLQTNGGTSLRDVVNRIESQQKRDRVLLRQVANAVKAAGLQAPVDTEDGENHD